MPTSVPRLAGRLAVALLLVLLAAGTVLAAATTRPSPAGDPPAEETSSPTAELATESPTAEPTAEASIPAPSDPVPTDAPIRQPEPAGPTPTEDADDEDADGDPSAANVARVVEKLAAHGITTSADQLAALAAKAGLGGAVRVLVFADATGKTPAEILAVFESGKGWGVIAKELGLHPGIGSIMGNGKGLDKAAKAVEKAAKARERAERKGAVGD